jgi:hypothetical protein
VFLHLLFFGSFCCVLGWFYEFLSFRGLWQATDRQYRPVSCQAHSLRTAIAANLKSRRSSLPQDRFQAAAPALLSESVGKTHHNCMLLESGTQGKIELNVALRPILC